MRSLVTTVGLLGLLWAGSAQARPADTACPSPTDDVDTILNDMKTPSEALPHGAKLTWTDKKTGRSYPTYAVKPRIFYGNKPPSRYGAVQGWGQLWQSIEPSTASHTLVELRRYRTYLLDKTTGRWERVQSSENVAGRAFPEDFHSKPPIPADAKPAPDGGTLVRMIPDRNFHFWPTSGRQPFDHDTLGGVFVTVQARLVPDESGVDDRAQANYLLSAGLDYWTAAGAAYKGDKVSNGDAGIGRFKRVGVCWRTYTMTTVPADVFRTNPPPLD
ncbi:MAG: hypothetical protein J7515_12865 [Caulobacter sp.]|nr:hypothetical protein [Caulobacter sp.]